MYKRTQKDHVYIIKKAVLLQSKKNNNAMVNVIKKQHDLPQSLLSEAKKVLGCKWNYPSMQSFSPKGKTIMTLFQVLFPTNTNYNEVYVKTSILNQFYSTNIFAISKLAKGIAELNNIDADLAIGNMEAVERIAHVLSRCNYSFASKYCAMHNPCAYPINDSLVRGYLANVIAKGNLKGYEGKKTNVAFNMRKNYAYYKEVYDAFMKQYDLTTLGYNGVDGYIWIACKEKLYSYELFKLI